MKEAVEIFKILADTARLRILQLLVQEELTVTELAQLLNMPQSRVSSQLQRIKAVFPLCERGDGRKTYLSLSAEQAAEPVLTLYHQQISESRIGQLDQEALEQLVAARKAKAVAHQGQGSLGKQDLPGRTWEGFARSLLTLIPKQRILDVGVGEGEMTLLLARFATELHAVDPDKAQLTRLAAKAKEQEVTSLSCHEADVASLPLKDKSVDLVIVSQLLHLLADPEAALLECVRVLDQGGRLIVLDLLSHDEAWVRERFGHETLGFSLDHLKSLLSQAGLQTVESYPVAKDRKPPRFVSVLATGKKGME